MLFDLINFSKLRRAIVYGVLLLVLLVLQELVIGRITVMGIHALIIPAAVVAVGLFDGAGWGGFFGLAAGFFCDLGYPDQLCLFTVLFSVGGFFSGVMGKYFLHKGFLSYVFLFLLLTAATTFCQMFHFLVFTDTRSWPVWRTGLIQILWSLPWIIPIYFPCKSIAERPLF